MIQHDLLHQKYPAAYLNHTSQVFPPYQPASPTTRLVRYVAYQHLQQGSNESMRFGLGQTKVHALPVFTKACTIIRCVRVRGPMTASEYASTICTCHTPLRVSYRLAAKFGLVQAAAAPKQGGGTASLAKEPRTSLFLMPIVHVICAQDHLLPRRDSK